MTDRFPPTDAAPLPPEPPEEGECCESECGDGCIWTRYRQARAAYEQALAAWKARQSDRMPGA